MARYGASASLRLSPQLLTPRLARAQRYRSAREWARRKTRPERGSSLMNRAAPDKKLSGPCFMCWVSCESRVHFLLHRLMPGEFQVPDRVLQIGVAEPCLNCPQVYASREMPGCERPRRNPPDGPLPDGVSPVHDKNTACHVACGVTGEVDGGWRHLTRLRYAAHGNGRQPGASPFFIG